MGNRNERILILDDNIRFMEALSNRLKKAGFRHLTQIDTADAAAKSLSSWKPHVLLVDIRLETSNRDGLVFLREARKNGFAGLAVVISSDGSTEQLFRAAKAGANDFLIKDARVEFGIELLRLLKGDRGARGVETLKRPISDLGYLRSFGLTATEIASIEEFAVDFPCMDTLAERFDRSTVQLRKTFSRIYRKLDVDNIQQLARLLVICEMFARQS